LGDTSKGFIVSKLPDLPVVHVAYTVPRDDIENAHREIAQEVIALLNGSEGRFYRINDFTAIDHLPIFSPIIRAMPMEIRGEPGTSSDPRITPLFVGQSQSVQILVDGLAQPQYGGWKPKLFPTVDAALDYVRYKIAASSNSSA
jgi:hypothetical protein